MSYRIISYCQWGVNPRLLTFNPQLYASPGVKAPTEVTLIAGLGKRSSATTRMKPGWDAWENVSPPAEDLRLSGLDLSDKQSRKPGNCERSSLLPLPLLIMEDDCDYLCAPRPVIFLCPPSSFPLQITMLSHCCVCVCVWWQFWVLNKIRQIIVFNMKVIQPMACCSADYVLLWPRLPFFVRVQRSVTKYSNL